MYKVYNPTTRKYDTFTAAELDEIALAPGQTIIRLYHSNTAGWVTIPGASLYTVNAKHELALDES